MLLPKYSLGLARQYIFLIYIRFSCSLIFRYRALRSIRFCYRPMLSASVATSVLLLLLPNSSLVLGLRLS